MGVTGNIKNIDHWLHGTRCVVVKSGRTRGFFATLKLTPTDEMSLEKGGVVENGTVFETVGITTDKTFGG